MHFKISDLQLKEVTEEDNIGLLSSILNANPSLLNDDAFWKNQLILAIGNKSLRVAEEIIARKPELGFERHLDHGWSIAMQLDSLKRTTATHLAESKLVVSTVERPGPANPQLRRESDGKSMITVFQVIENDNIDDFSSLLSVNPSLLDDDTLGICLLFLAIGHGSALVVEEIIARKPELASGRNPSDCCSTAMHLAASKGLVSIVEKLNAVNPQLRRVSDGESMIPLHIAVVCGHEAVVKFLTDKESLMKKNAAEQTVLHLALRYLRSEIFEFLVKKVGEYNLEGLLNNKDKDGNDPLHIATRNTLERAVRLLLFAEPGSSTTTRRMAVRVNSMNNRGQTPLDLHCQQNRCDQAALEVRKLLHEARALEGRRFQRQQNILIDVDDGDGGEPCSTPRRRLSKARGSLLTVVVMIAGSIFCSVLGLTDTILNEKNKAGVLYFHRDVISGGLPNFFYFLAVNTAGFIVSIGVILHLVWSLPFWTVYLFLAITFSIGYSIFVSKIMPRFHVRIGSRNIVSKWFLWLLVGEIICIVAAASGSLLLLVKLFNWFKARLMRLVGL